MEDKCKGGIEYLSAIMLISLAGIVLMYIISYKEIKQYQYSVKDNLDSACLAAACADLSVYENEARVEINYQNAKDIFFDTLMQNMKLEDDFTVPEGEIYDKITVHRFIVYNISGDMIEMYDYKDGSNYSYSSGVINATPLMPNGERIDNCTVYADIGMEVHSFAGINKYVHVISSADIVENR